MPLIAQEDLKTFSFESYAIFTAHISKENAGFYKNVHGHCIAKKTYDVQNDDFSNK
jgi:hypothetical protein